jgi:L,D-peptidoglycan transpeptidase YkuD (ErfK/YbiS/YcfS/YnhG family)
MAEPETRPFAALADAGGVTGWLAWPGGGAACVFGRSGVSAAETKTEGDGATPLGAWPLREVFYRPDRLSRPDTRLPATALTPAMGWCDDPASPLYNQRVALPFAASHEMLWREDGVYDLIVPLGYNDDPVRPGAGSAIFLHLKRTDGAPTQGCVATDRDALLALLRVAKPGDALTIATR